MDEEDKEVSGVGNGREGKEDSLKDVSGGERLGPLGVVRRSL
jgi:hypothetical protein